MNILRNDADLIVHIKPKVINFQIKKGTTIIDRLEKIRLIEKRFILEEQRFEQRISIEKIKKYQCIKSLIDNLDNYSNSYWYKDFIKKIQTQRKDKHKRFILKTNEDVDTLFTDYLIPLIKNMESGFDSNQSNEFGYLVIDADGTLLKSSHANHRFYIAKILNLQSFPLLINGIHESWAKKNLTPCMSKDKMREVIRNHCLTWTPEINSL